MSVVLRQNASGWRLKHAHELAGLHGEITLLSKPRHYYRVAHNVFKRRHITPIQASGGNDAMTPDEQRFFDEYLEQRRAARKAEVKEYKRRVKFDPMAKTPDQVQGLQQEPSADTVDAAHSSLADPPAASTKAGIDMINQPASIQAKDQSEVEQNPAAGIPDSTSDATTGILRQSGKAIAGATSAQARASDDNDNDEDEEDVSEADFAAAAQQFLQEETARVRKAASSAASTSGRSAAPASPKTRARALPSTLVKRNAMKSKNDELQRLLKQAAAANDDDSDDDDDDERPQDDIDWQALTAYESFKKYVDELDQEQAKKARRTAAARRSSGRAPAGSNASNRALGAAGRSKPASKQAAAGPKRDAADRALDEVEELLKFFELVEKSSAAESKAKASKAAGQPGSARHSVQLTDELEDDIDWGVLERMFLGKDWDCELQGLLAENSSRGSATNQGAGTAAVDSNAEEEEPWADEVTSLLLGLVMISHQQYLNKAMLPREVPEDERAAAFWEAPFALVVQDDSKAAALEYANKTALKLFGFEFEDVYEKTSFDLVDPDSSHQQEWLWSITDVEEKYERYTVVPQLRMMGASGKPFIAKDVLVFQVNSLEGDKIGQAIMFKKWDSA